MRMPWRLALVAVVAAAVLGGLVPRSVASGAASIARPAVQLVQEPLSVPVSCADAVCGKGSPAPTAPSPAAPLAAVLGFAIAAAAAVATLKHCRSRPGALPAGVPEPQFHPPKFS
jgi:hypothetical protein